MKIGFVSQGYDVLLPPFQNSVGACTYGVATRLTDCDFIAYAEANSNSNVIYPDIDRRHFRLLPATTTDRYFYKGRSSLSRLVQISSPLSTSGLFFAGWGRRVARDLADQSCDVIHIQHNSQYAPVMRKYNPNAKIVLHLHAEWFSQSNPAMLRRRLQHVDLLTTVSDYITNKTKKQFPEIVERCETMYNGIDASEFSRERHYNQVSARRPKRILYAGALSPHKGVHDLVEAMERVAQQFPDVHLDIVGVRNAYPVEETFDQRNVDALNRMAPFYPKKGLTYLKSKVSRQDGTGEFYETFLMSKLTDRTRSRVSFRGMVPRHELIDLYYDADIFVFPPIWDEGFGLPPVEAMAAGVPVVATKSGAIVETVVHGQTGFLVEKNAPQELAAAMLTLLRDDGLREKMGRAGRLRALSHFTWSAVATAMRDRYRYLVDNGS